PFRCCGACKKPRQTNLTGLLDQWWIHWVLGMQQLQYLHYRSVRVSMQPDTPHLEASEGHFTLFLRFLRFLPGLTGGGSLKVGSAIESDQSSARRTKRSKEWAMMATDSTRVATLPASSLTQ